MTYRPGPYLSPSGKMVLKNLLAGATPDAHCLSDDQRKSLLQTLRSLRDKGLIDRNRCMTAKGREIAERLLADLERSKGKA